MKNWFAVGWLGVAAGLTVSAVADDDHGRGHNRGKRIFRAELVSYNEVPSVSSPARGQFYATLNKAEDKLTYWLSFSDLTEDVSQAHIHLGQHHTNGGIVVWLCKGTVTTAPAATTPVCGGPRTSSVTGVITPAEVVGLAVGTRNQGINSGEFVELIAAMRAGAAYANVHSGAVVTTPVTIPPTPTLPNVGFPGGEIRGQIN
jgi:hypothetical protein